MCGKGGYYYTNDWLVNFGAFAYYILEVTEFVGCVGCLVRLCVGVVKDRLMARSCFRFYLSTEMVLLYTHHIQIFGRAKKKLSFSRNNEKSTVGFQFPKPTVGFACMKYACKSVHSGFPRSAIAVPRFLGISRYARSSWDEKEQSCRSKTNFLYGEDVVFPFLQQKICIFHIRNLAFFK